MKLGASRLSWVLGTFLVFSGAAAQATDAIPPCLAYGRPLPINNDQVLHWKRTTPNQFRERGHISGVVRVVYNDHSGHDHFSIQIGHNQGDSIEVIYNQDFGALPDTIPIGAQVEACGDFIVATAQSGPYPPSPDGAIIHWVHMNPAGKGHDPGFLMINGTLYGQDASHAGPGRPPYYPKPNKGGYGYNGGKPGNGGNGYNGGKPGNGNSGYNNPGKNGWNNSGSGVNHFQSELETNGIEQFTFETPEFDEISEADLERN